MENREVSPILNTRALLLIAGSLMCTPIVVAVAFICFFAMTPTSIAGFLYHGGDFVTQAATDITFVYADGDAPSMTGRYSVHLIPCGQVLRSIDKQAAAAHWITARKTQERREYFRDRELVRVAVRDSEADCRVAVGWLMFDFPAASPYASVSHRARWARENLWPRFEKALLN